jgi:hypothetical protein
MEIFSAFRSLFYPIFLLTVARFVIFPLGSDSSAEGTEYLQL